MENYSFWRDVLERTWRNALQTLAPIVAVMAASGAPVNPDAVAVSAATVVFYTVVKAVAGVTAGSGAPLWVQLLDRAGSAVAATLLAFLPEAAMHTWVDWVSVDWATVGWASLGAAVLAVINYVAAPPAFAREPFEAGL